MVARRRPDGAPAPSGDDRAERFVEILVQPRAPRTEVVGMQGGAVKIAVAAPPVGGAANAELIRFLAKRCGVPRSAIHIAGGATGRRKRLGVTGMDAVELARRILGGG